MVLLAPPPHRLDWILNKPECFFHQQQKIPKPHQITLWIVEPQCLDLFWVSRIIMMAIWRRSELHSPQAIERVNERNTTLAGRSVTSLVSRLMKGSAQKYRSCFPQELRFKVISALLFVFSLCYRLFICFCTFWVGWYSCLVNMF